jgi:hypothetical protein
MRIKFMFLLLFVATISLTFVFGFIVPHRSSNISLLESTLVPSKVALLEPLTLTLDAPSVIRLGDVVKIRLTVTVDEDGNANAASNESTATQEMDLNDAFDSYNVIAETRLDLSRLSASSAELMSQPIRAGQSITFTWTVRADAVGECEGTAWFFLRFVPKGNDAVLAEQGSSPGSELAVAAIPFDLRVVSFQGIKGITARIIGMVGLFVSLLIALPLLLDRLVRPKQ